jgi:hypothetical protein
MEQISLYHSFPRGADPEHRAALSTLGCFAKIGFVLVPEVVTLREQLSAGDGRIMRIGQKRICFTEIDTNAISGHARTFGAFAIEFDLMALSAIGATPVFYLPPAPTMPGMGGLAESLVINLGDIANLLDELSKMRQAIERLTATDSCSLAWNGNTHRIGVADLSAVLAFLEHKHGSAKTLHNAIRGLGQLFYPTHNDRYVNEMAYYRQREWRIIGDIAVGGRLTMRDLTADEKAALLVCNMAFFGKEVDLLDGRHRRVDQCRLYLSPDDRHPFSAARRVIVPKPCVQTAEKVLHDQGWALPVIAIEELDMI